MSISHRSVLTRGIALSSAGAVALGPAMDAPPAGDVGAAAQAGKDPAGGAAKPARAARSGW